MYISLRQHFKKWFYHAPVLWPLIETLQGLVYVADYFYYYRMPGHKNRLSVREINIEFASQCNLRCTFCSLDHFKPKQAITAETLDLFFSQMLADSRFRKVEVINLHNGGEILLHPQRLEMLAIIGKYKQQARALRLPFPEIRMLTNGMLLREKLAEDILQLGVVDVIGLSFDGGTPESFEAMRKNAAWKVFHQNVKNLHAVNARLGKPARLYGITCIPADKPLHNKWMHPEFRELYELLDWSELRRLHNWAGEISTVAVREKRHKIGCSMLMKQMVLLPNGDITVCCSDLNSKGVVGNVRQQDLVSILHSENRKRYLSLLLRRRKSQLDLCRECETF